MVEAEISNQRPQWWQRWWIYQRERFPLVAHGPAIAAFAFCAAAYSAHLRAGVWPQLTAVLVAFFSSLGFFLQLRIADEFKDQEEDARYRPYRAVPRGLVSLRELGWVFVAAGILQVAVAWAYDPRLCWLLLIAWIYLGAMAVEFGVGDWLRARPLAYLFSHMLIMPIVDAYATSSDWLVAGTGMPAGLPWFLALSFTNGLVIELGRKVRAPADEETGVNTYSALWGPHRAALIWLIVLIITAGLAWRCADLAQAALPVMAVLGPAVLLIAIVVARFLARQPAGRGKQIELAAGCWTLLLYLSLGVIPGLLGS